MKINYYDILSQGMKKPLNENSTVLEIKKSFRKLSLIHHPDKGGNPDTFKELVNAYEILSDEEKRKRYDSGLNSEEWAPNENADVSYSNNQFQKKKIDKQVAEDPNKDFSKEEEDVEDLYKQRERIYSPKELKVDLEDQSILSFRTMRSFQSHFGYYSKARKKTHDPFLRSSSSRIGGIDIGRWSRNLRDFFVGKTHFQDSLDDLTKYIANSRARYRDSRQVILGLAQPLSGINYLLTALLLLMFSFSMLIFKISDMLFDHSNFPIRSSEVGYAAANFIIYFFYGLIQLITTPLTWFIYMPLRGLNTLINGWAVVEEGHHMKRIINEASSAIEEGNKFAIIASIALIHKKFQKAIKEQQNCRINDSKLEADLYKEVDKDFILGTLNVKSSIPITVDQKKHLLNYLGFFKTKAFVEDQQPPAPELDAML